MRCPKCGYISFDHNQICPKCNKDISDEQAKLNLPAYKSNPPSLLGALVGSEDESSDGFTLNNSSAMQNAGVDIDFGDASTVMENDELDFGGEDEDLEISLNDDEELSMNMDEISFEDGDTADEIALDLGEAASKATSDFSSEEKSGMELNVNDLKINETGELEISSVPDEILSSGEFPEEDEITIDQIDIDSDDDLKIAANNTGSLDLSDLTFEEAGDAGAGEGDGLDLGDLAIEGGSEEDSLNLSDLTFDDTGTLTKDEISMEDDFDIDKKETGELHISDFEENKSKKSTPADKGIELKPEGEEDDDEITIDLENLDLDLDLEDSEDKK